MPTPAAARQTTPPARSHQEATAEHAEAAEQKLSRRALRAPRSLDPSTLPSRLGAAHVDVHERRMRTVGGSETPRALEALELVQHQHVFDPIVGEPGIADGGHVVAV